MKFNARFKSIFLIASLVAALSLILSPLAKTQDVNKSWAILLSGFMPRPIGEGTIDRDMRALKGSLEIHYGFQ